MVSHPAHIPAFSEPPKIASNVHFEAPDHLDLEVILDQNSTEPKNVQNNRIGSKFMHLGTLTGTWSGYLDLESD